MRLNAKQTTKEDLEPIKDLEFVITDDMKETIFQMITLQQILNSKDLSKRERKMLEQQKQELLNSFRTDLQQLNPTQTMIVRTFLSGKKIKRIKHQNLILFLVILSNYFFFGLPYFLDKSIPLIQVKQLTAIRPSISINLIISL